MKNVWLCIPSARPPGEAEKVLSKWRAQGYKIALWLDFTLDGPANLEKVLKYDDVADVIVGDGAIGYPGYAKAVNAVIADRLIRDPEAEWFVIGGDDTEPDMNHTAEEIARQCREYFAGRSGGARFDPKTVQMSVSEFEQSRTFGVMQPTGDRFANACIEKVAGSAWIGREFARRAYGGKGPLWPEYTRFFMDEELQEVATRWGVFHQRRDLIHLHRHYMRESDALDAGAIRTEIPEHLKAQEVKWKAEQDIFNKRKHARPTPFPGSEPIP